MVKTLATTTQIKSDSSKNVTKQSRSGKNLNLINEPEVQIQWLKSGKPVITGLKNISKTVEVSLAHDDRLCLCTAGISSQGCDIACVDSREHDDWLTLLGNSREFLLEQLITQCSDALDLAGTRIWAAIEALRKATKLTNFKLVLDRQDKDSIVFRGSASGTELCVLTFPLQITRGKPRIVALVVPDSKAQQIISNPADRHLEYPANIYCFGTEEKTGSCFFYVRWPVSYKNVANLSQTVYFSNFFSWIEQVRDLALLPIRETLGEYLATGQWGMVTNFAELEVVGEAGLDDVIESRIGVSNASVSNNSTVDFNYDWLKVLPNGNQERVAVGKLQMTWVKLTKNEPPQPLPLPKFLQEFIAQISNYTPESLPESFKDISKGEKLYEIPSGPSPGLLLKEQSFSTCLEETDAIGNINFQNYYIFQGRLRDGFFQEIIPEYYRRDLKQGEFRCLHSKVDFLREAFPFDCIEVKMYLQALYESSVSLVFEYFRCTPNGVQEKLAVGKQDAIWLVPNENGTSFSASMPMPMPSKVKTNLLKNAK
jgi:enediyne polyketide synthase